MNNEAEDWIANVRKEILPDGDAIVPILLRQAMAWAYADAAKVCKTSFANHFPHSQRRIGAELCAEAIEGRAK